MTEVFLNLPNVESQSGFVGVMFSSDIPNSGYMNMKSLKVTSDRQPLVSSVCTTKSKDPPVGSVIVTQNSL